MIQAMTTPTGVASLGFFAAAPAARARLCRYSLASAAVAACARVSMDFCVDQDLAKILR